MKKFGYIINSFDKVVERFRTNNLRAAEFESLLEVNLSDIPTGKFYKITNQLIIKNKLESKIRYYLSIRNNENPDYEIEWKGRFLESDMFNFVMVLGNEMKLFSGNEDNLIMFLSNIHNQLNDGEIELRWVLVKNHAEFLKLRV
ncbi:hypothetical protein [Flammeovirga aprica]|uniref:Uncharacterized protein n=1 Tax=Flammeovirga aprica JL-4 TaxID=694437 RepID=A0A7X9RUW6_9BACT|nr:hypothetical protein [Flammeovirga aprica]NME69169.1 hypothetical protein [Flammeovirga aprica JL-4]